MTWMEAYMLFVGFVCGIALATWAADRTLKRAKSMMAEASGLLREANDKWDEINNHNSERSDDATA